MLRSRVAVASVVTAMTLVSCGTAPTPRASDSPLVMGTNAASTLEIVVEGAESFRFSGAVDLRIVIGGLDPNIPENLGFLSVGLLAPVTLEDGRFVRTAFDLLGYQGAGDYEFGPGAKARPGFQPPAGIESNTFVELTELPNPVVTFNQLGAKCTLTLTADARSGSLTCPDVAAETGERISMRTEWAPL
jgi:hypothetical protein